MPREKRLFLPEQRRGDSHSNTHTERPSPARAEYPCPCCGEITYPVPAADALAYICPVCWWENDLFTTSDDEPSDENRGVTLNQARESYRQCGLCDPRLLDNPLVIQDRLIPPSKLK